MRRLRLCLHLLLLDFKKNRGFVVAMIGILGIGYLGLIIAQVFQSASVDFLTTKARQTLAADVAVSSFRDFTPSDLKGIDEELKPLKRAHELEMMTMVRSSKASLLVEVKGIDENFPLVGDLNFTADSVTSERPVAWVAPEVLEQLQIHVGEEISIGAATLIVARVFTNDPGTSQTSPGLSPRIYIPLQSFQKSGLIQPGSQIVRRFYFLVAPDVDVVRARNRLEAKFTDVFVRTPEDSIRGLNRFFSFFGRYMAAIALAVFLLSFAASSYLFQIFLQERTHISAIYLTFGATFADLAAMTALQTASLSFLGASLALAVCHVLLMPIPSLFHEVWPEGFHLLILPIHVFDVVTTSIAFGFFFSLPFVLRLHTLRPTVLLSESVAGHFLSWDTRRMSSFLPMIFLITLLAWRTLQSVSNAAIFVGALVALSMLSYLVARLSFMGLAFLTRGASIQVRLPVVNLKRGRFDLFLCLLTLTLVAIVMNVVPHLRATLLQEIEPSEGAPRPSFFIINIPEDELTPLQTFLETKGSQLNFVSPLILAQLTAVNGQTPHEDWFRKFPVRLSYRDGTLSSESFVAGTRVWSRFDPDQQKLPFISLEKEFAARNALKLGDHLQFDVQGLPIEAVVSSLRRVNWSSFQPNFFIQFQPGVLEEAPKTFIGTVATSGPSEHSLQFEVARTFPNITLINVSQMIERVLSLTAKVVLPIQVIAGAALAVASLLILAVVMQSLKLRIFEIDVYKTFGASLRQVSQMMSAEYFILSLFATCFGSLVGLCISVGVCVYFLDLTPRVSWGALVGFNLALVALVTVAAWLSTHSVLKNKRPLSLLT